MKLLKHTELEHIFGGICTTLKLNNITGVITYTNCLGPQIITPQDVAYEAYLEMYTLKKPDDFGVVIYC